MANDRMRYFLSETHFFDKGYSVLVITILGPFVAANATTFIECLDQINKVNSKWIILNFRDVPSKLDETFVPGFIKLRQTVQESEIKLRISGLHPDLRKVLKEKNLTLDEEVVNNLTEAIDSLPSGV